MNKNKKNRSGSMSNEEYREDAKKRQEKNKSAGSPCQK